MPWYLDLLFAIPGAYFLYKLGQILRDGSPGRQAEFAEARKIAERLARSDHFVEDAGDKGLFGSKTILLKTADMERNKYSLKVPRRHPDIRAARRLGRLDRIRFDYHLKPLRGVSKAEPAAYLRMIG